MLEILLPLILSLPSAKYLPKKVPEAAIRDIENALRLTPALPFKENPKESTARLLFVWSFFESAWQLSALGDRGNSCGRMQTNKHWADCKRARTDGVYGYTEALRIMHLGTKKCGSLVGALAMYSSGSCSLGVKGVLARCKRAGVTC